MTIQTESDLLKTLEEGVLTITMNRPERLNALTIPLMRHLGEALRKAEIDPDVRVVVLRGAGKGFCSGGDVKEGRKDDLAGDRPKTDPGYKQAEQRYDRLRRAADSPILLRRMLKPTIAMVRGAATGAGFNLAAACDFRIASETAFFMTAFARGGFSGDFGGSYFLTRLVGTAKARELFLLNPRIEAEQAERLGLLTRLVPDAELEQQTMAFAKSLASGPRVAFRYMKENLNAAENDTLENIMDLEIKNMVRSSQTEDQQEAVRAMVEKREPCYKGY
jgi:2-(1,2-epoxy-1,2-dihydrophenyl)acetyl-CoA isomerase